MGPWAAVLVLALALGLVACDDDAPAPSETPSHPAAAEVRPEALTPLWAVSAPAGAEADGALRHWVVGDRLVVVGAREITAYGLDDGKQAWTTSLPKGAKKVCTASATPNADGVGALVLQGLGGCGIVTRLDTGTGRFGWRRTITPVSGDDPDVTVTRAVVAAVGRCGQVNRFALATGRALPAAAKATKACANESALLGGLVVVERDRGASYGEVGDKLIVPDEATATFALLDVDTLKQRWAAPVAREGAALHGILTEQPLVLDRTLLGHRMLQVVGPEGKTQRTIGWALNEDGFRLIGRDGSTIVGDFGRDDPAGFAFDLDSGKQLWTDLDDRATTTFGVRDGEVLRARVLPAEEGDGDETWIAAHPLRRGSDAGAKAAVANAEVTLLGRFASGATPPTLTLAKDVLVAADGGELTAYSLPAEGRAASALPVTRAEAAAPWTDEDIRTESAQGACRAVTNDALTRLGMRSGALPNPVGCRWRERFEPTYVDRALETSVRVVPPTEDATGAEAALAAADKTLDRLAKGPGLVAEPVDGLGDAAWFASRPSSDGTRMATALVSVTRNVVVTVRVRQQSVLEERFADLTTPDAVDRGTREAAGDILRYLGASVTDEKRGKDGAVTSVPALCKTLAARARTLVPKGPVVDTTPTAANRRMSGCYWGGLQTVYPYLGVTVYAVPGSAVTGASGEATAKAIFAGDEKDTPVAGLGQEADVWGFRQQGGRVGTRVLTVRQGNVLVTVRYGAAKPDAALLQSARGVASAVLAAAS